MCQPVPVFRGGLAFLPDLALEELQIVLNSMKTIKVGVLI